MPRVNRLRRARQQAGLTDAQELELIIGPAGQSAFPDDHVRRAAWHQHRDELLAAATPTTRPWAFWEYENERVHPRPGKSLSVLEAGGQLTPEEQRWVDRRPK